MTKNVENMFQAGELLYVIIRILPLTNIDANFRFSLVYR